MKKAFCLSFGFIFCGLNVIFAQGGITMQQRKAAANTVYAVLKQYLKVSKLYKQGVPGITEEKKQAFLSIFEEDAIVWDDITPANFPNKFLTNNEKTIDNLIVDYEQYFPKGITIKYLNSAVSFENLTDKTAQIAIQRTISGEYMGQYFISNQGAILELELKLSDDYTTAKISSIRKLVGNPISCLECPQPAGSVASKESGKGEKTPMEKPGVTLSFNLSGSGNSATIEKPELSKMNYDSLIMSKSSLIEFSSKGGAAFSGDVNVSLMFGKSKKIGIGAGLFFNYSQAKLTYDTLHLAYKGGQNENGLPDFMRLYTAYNVSENISMNNLGANLILRYNSGTDKTGFYIDCGPVFILSSVVSSKYTATADYEAVYQYDGNGYYFDSDAEIDGNDWVITKEAFHASDQDSQTEDEYFNSLQNFNVGINKKDAARSEKYKFKQVYGGLLRMGASIPMSEKINFTAGISAIYLKMLNNSDYNKPLMEKMGKYNTALSAVNEISNFNLGVNVGLVVKLYKTTGNK